jgi:uncharacterized cupin superfamily protein
MVGEARLVETGEGLVPEGEGWFVVNARDVPWGERPGAFGLTAAFEGRTDFPHIGVNLRVLPPGRPNCYYHGESNQEDLLVLAGECLLLVEGEERRLRAWDFVHLPPWTDHVLVGAGDEPAVVVMIGGRFDPDRVRYPRADVAVRHDASVREETESAEEAYGHLQPWRPRAYQEGSLP